MPDVHQMEILQSSAMSLCGKNMTVDMHMAVDSNPLKRSVTFRMIKGNYLMKKVEGRFEVWALDDLTELKRVAAHIPEGELQRIVDEHHSANMVDGPRATRASVVLIHQRVQPTAVPPYPFKSLLRQHLGKHFEAVLSDLQVGAVQATAERAKNGSGAVFKLGF